MSLSSAGISDIGRQRDLNEDRLLLRPDFGLFAVVDGMGGHEKGEVASTLAVETLESVWASSDPEQGVGERLRAAVLGANREILKQGGGTATRGGMGATVVAAAVDERRGEVHVCHAGDSRCYRLRGDAIEQLTQDHNMRNDVLAIDPNADQDLLDDLPTNVVTRALGMQANLDATLRTEAVEPGDVLLLCSDGLTGEVSDEMLQQLADDEDLEMACQKLIDRANAVDGSDNVTVLLVRVDALELGAPASGAERDVASERQPELDADGLALPPRDDGPVFDDKPALDTDGLPMPSQDDDQDDDPTVELRIIQDETPTPVSLPPPPRSEDEDDDDVMTPVSLPAPISGELELDDDVTRPSSVVPPSADGDSSSDDT